MLPIGVLGGLAGATRLDPLAVRLAVEARGRIWPSIDRGIGRAPGTAAANQNSQGQEGSHELDRHGGYFLLQ